MATIDDLPIPNFTDLSDSDAMELILAMRARRLAGMQSEPRVRRVAKSKTKGKSIDKLLSKLTPEQLTILMERMGRNGT
jgi:hypothetical protein